MDPASEIACERAVYFAVMAGLVPAIHVFCAAKTWMPGTSSAKTRFALRPGMTTLGACDYSAAWRWARASRSNASSSTVWIGVKSRCAMYSGRVGVRI